MKIKNIRMHNRPAYNSEVHGTRDMGVGELNNCYEDAELVDTVFAVGTNRTNQALVNITLATGNIGRPGGGCVRMGGHQEGYVRPDYPGGKPAPYIDQPLISGKGGVHHIWGCDHFKITLNATEFKRIYKRRTDLVKAAMDSVPAGDRDAQVKAIADAIGQGGLFIVDMDIVPTQIGTCAHVMLERRWSTRAGTSTSAQRF
jgi:anaerobic selenocysteine-containing dehydrogenase